MMKSNPVGTMYVIEDAWYIITNYDCLQSLPVSQKVLLLLPYEYHSKKLSNCPDGVIESYKFTEPYVMAVTNSSCPQIHSTVVRGSTFMVVLIINVMINLLNFAKMYRNILNLLSA